MNWEPYTLDELRQLDGEPFWFYDCQEETGRWKVLKIFEFPGHWEISLDGWWGDMSAWDKTNYGKTWLAYPAPPEEAFEQHQRATMARLRPCRECTYFSDNLLEHGTKPEDKVHWCDRYEIVLDGGCTCGTFKRYRDEKEGCQNV